MIRMEIALIIVMLIVAFVYFSVERDYSMLHKTFAILLVSTIVHLFFDGATLYTVNHMDTVSEHTNDIMHRFFILTMLFIVYLFYQYIKNMIEDDLGMVTGIDVVAVMMLGIVEVVSFVTPLEYIETPQGNYAAGTAATVCYVSIVLYLGMCISIFLKNCMKINHMKRCAIGAALSVVLIVTVVQYTHPTWLISGMGITLMTLTFYLTLESPFIVRAELMEQKMSMLYLKSQVNPHFLYNTLDTIRIQAQLNDDKQVAALLMKLADFFRLSIKVGRQKVALDDELELLEAYMELMCYRYPQLTCTYDIDPDLGDMLVPNFILQPIVENSLLHGLKNTGYRGDITIVAERSKEEKKCMEIKIIDTGSGFLPGRKEFVDDILQNYKRYAPQVDGDSVGIVNVQKRIKLLCGNRCGLWYTENEGAGLTAHILLTLEREGDEKR